jgi:uncharacterized domain 1
MNQLEVENRGIDKNVFDIIRARYNEMPCYQTMGIQLTYLAEEAAGMQMVPNVSLSSSGGRVHGGVIATLADAVMGAAGGTMGYLYRTAEMKLNYITPAFDNEELIAEARVIHPGKTLAVIEGNLFNKNGKMIAKSLGTFFRDKNYAAYTKSDHESL